MKLTFVKLSHAPACACVLVKPVALAVAGLCGLVLLAATGANAATLHTAFVAGADGLDPAVHESALSRQVQEAVFQRLLRYESGVLPARLVPMAAGLPTVSDEGRRFDFTLRGDAHWHAAGGTRGAPLTAADVADAIKRLALPQSTVAGRELIIDKVRGLRDFAERASRDPAWRLEDTVAGIQVLGPWAIRFELNAPDHDFPHLLAMPMSSIVPRVGLAAGTDVANGLAGTGPFTIERWDLNAGQVVLTHKQPQTLAPGHISRVVISRVPDEAARLALFDSGAIDYIDRPRAVVTQRFMSAGVVKPEFARQGVRLHRQDEPAIIYYYINLRDPVLGGMTPARKALRRAILQSYDVAQEIAQIRDGLGRVGLSPLPAVVEGAGLPYPLQHSVAQANQTLDEAGYARGADGWRRTPEGQPLTVVFSSEPLDGVRPYAELRRQRLADVGLRMDTRLQTYRENITDSMRCGLAFWGSVWGAGVPTPGYFLQLLYGPNVARGINLACYESAEFDQLFERARRTPPGAEHQALVAQMLALAAADGVWQIGTTQQALALLGPRVQRFERHPLHASPWLQMTVADQPDGVRQ